MPVPTYEQLMAASKAQIDAWAVDTDLAVVAVAGPHKVYRENLIQYAEDLIEAAEAGIGSNPPGNPPQPPGT